VIPVEWRRSGGIRKRKNLHAAGSAWPTSRYVMLPTMHKGAFSARLRGEEPVITKLYVELLVAGTLYSLQPWDEKGEENPRRLMEVTAQTTIRSSISNNRRHRSSKNKMTSTSDPPQTSRHHASQLL
jgi:hypothetical protein